MSAISVLPTINRKVSLEEIGRFSDRLSAMMNELREQGVGTQVLYIPVHLQPWYRNTYGYGVGKCPKAETAYAGLLSLPLFPAMTEADVFKVVKSVTSL